MKGAKMTYDRPWELIYMYERDRGGLPEAVLVDRYRTKREAEQERQTIPTCPGVITFVRRRPDLC
jgi:hypothetical protein